MRLYCSISLICAAVVHSLNICPCADYASGRVRPLSYKLHPIFQLILSSWMEQIRCHIGQKTLSFEYICRVDPIPEPAWYSRCSLTAHNTLSLACFRLYFHQEITLHKNAPPDSETTWTGHSCFLLTNGTNIYYWIEKLISNVSHLCTHTTVLVIIGLQPDF